MQDVFDASGEKKGEMKCQCMPFPHVLTAIKRICAAKYRMSNDELRTAEVGHTLRHSSFDILRFCG